MAETVCLLGPGTGSALSLQNHCLALMTVNVDSSGGVKERPDDHCVLPGCEAHLFINCSTCIVCWPPCT